MYKKIIILTILLILLSGCNLLGNSNIKHFNKSIDYANQATLILNQTGQFDSEVMIPLKKKAVKEAKQVDVEKFNKDYEGLGSHYKNEFIKGLELFIEGIETQDNLKSLQGQKLLDKWGDWYLNNIDEIKKL